MSGNRIHRRLCIEELEPRIAPTGIWDVWQEMGAHSATNGGISNDNASSWEPVIAIDGTGNPIVAWANYRVLGQNMEVYVRQWDGSSWATMGPGSASGGGISNTDTDSINVALAINSDGHPIVAWGEDLNKDGYADHIYVLRWDGASWVELGAGSASGGGISNNVGLSMYPSIACGTDGRPVIAWMDKTGGDFEIYALRWDGSAWQEIGPGSASGGGISNNKGESWYPVVTLDTAGNPIVAWQDYSAGNWEIYVKRWNGASWVELGTSSGSGTGISKNKGLSQNPSLAIAVDGNPIVAWDDTSGGNREIYVKRWDGLSWVEIGSGSASGGGISNNAGASWNPTIIAGTFGNPIVAWADTTVGGSNSEIYIRRWDGTSWVEMPAGSASSTGISVSSGTSGYPAMTPGSNGNPIIAWEDATVQYGEIYVRRYVSGAPAPTTVTIVASDPNAYEAGPDIGMFTVIRTGDTSSPLEVLYSIGGTASSGADYDALFGAVTIGAGATSANITITPIDDANTEGDETVTLTLNTSGAYSFGVSHTATVLIHDNEAKPNYFISGQPKSFVDSDGSTVTVSLKGPGGGMFFLTNGGETGADMAALILQGTTEKSSLTITTKGGTPGTSLGGITLSNPSSAGGPLGTLSAKMVHLTPGANVSSEGFIMKIHLGNIGDHANILIPYTIPNFIAGTIGNGVNITAQGDITNFKAVAVGTGGSITALWGIKTLNITSGSLGGDILAQGAAGIGTISVPKGGFNGTIGAPSGGIKTLNINGTAGIAAGSVITTGTAGIGAMTVKGNADFTLKSTGAVKTLNITGTAKAPVTLSGIFDVRVLGTLNAANALVDGLTIRATDGVGKMSLKSANNLILSAGTIGALKVSGVLGNSLLLGGYDIGNDYKYDYGAGDDGIFGTTASGGNIGDINASTMSNTSIAANVKCGPDQKFGTNDDRAWSDTLVGHIKSLTVKTLIGATDAGGHAGVVAHGTMGKVIIGGKPVTPPWSDPLDTFTITAGIPVASQ